MRGTVLEAPRRKSSTRRPSACASYKAAEAFEAITCEALVSRKGRHAAVKALGAAMPPRMLLGPRVL
eukprot:176888-Prymnesium_polylepis.1